MFPYIYRWNRRSRKGQPGTVLVRGKMNSCLVMFEDGFTSVTSHNALRRRKLEGDHGADRRRQPCQGRRKGGNVVIVLCRLMTRMGLNLGEELARKMATNRMRQRNLTADGHSYHVGEKTNAIR